MLQPFYRCGSPPSTTDQYWGGALHVSTPVTPSPPCPLHYLHDQCISKITLLSPILIINLLLAAGFASSLYRSGVPALLAGPFCQ